MTKLSFKNNPQKNRPLTPPKQPKFGYKIATSGHPVIITCPVGRGKSSFRVLWVSNWLPKLPIQPKKTKYF